LAVLGGVLAAASVGAVLEVGVFRRMAHDEMRQTLVTIGLSIVAADLMLWWFGAQTYQMALPEWLDVPVTLPVIQRYPLVRLVVMAVAVAVGVALWAMLKWSRLGLMIRAGVDDKQMLASVGISPHLLFVAVFALGAGLAGLAGVIGGSTFVTEPAMAATVGSVIFVVVVVGGMGSLSGAFLASVLIGVIQTFAVAIDYSFLTLAKDMGWALSAATQENSFAKLTLSQVAPILPYLFLVLILIFRPKGLLGTRET
jgi:branched-chain amino acid transport system permease protein